MTYKKLSLTLSTLMLLLSGCDTIRNTLGLDHYQADAFAVQTNPPLVLPPDYNLTPPKPGAAPTYTQTPEVKAQETLQTNDAKIHSASGTEGSLLNHTSAAAPANIRELVDKEAADESTMAGKLEKQMKSWKEQAKENFGSLQDPSKTDEPEKKESFDEGFDS